MVFVTGKYAKMGAWWVYYRWCTSGVAGPTEKASGTSAFCDEDRDRAAPALRAARLIANRFRQAANRIAATQKTGSSLRKVIAMAAAAGAGQHSWQQSLQASIHTRHWPRHVAGVVVREFKARFSGRVALGPNTERIDVQQTHLATVSKLGEA